MTARNSDPITSHMASYDVRPRKQSQKQRLYEAYLNHPAGLTDEEAAIFAGLPPRSCWWKRCSELRDEGIIAHTGIMRTGSAGSKQMVSRLVAQSPNSSNGETP
jgi:hypothetical protein